MIREKVTEDNCKECIFFKDTEHKDNMIKHNICPKRSGTGCPE